MALNLDTIREDGQRELLEIFATLPGRKCLVLDTLLGGRLNHILTDGSKVLKENGVVYFRELRAELGAFPAAEGGEPDHILYLVRPSIAHMKLIASQIRTRLKHGAPEAFRYSVFFVPNKTLICEQARRCAAARVARVVPLRCPRRVADAESPTPHRADAAPLPVSLRRRGATLRRRRRAAVSRADAAARVAPTRCRAPTPVL